MFEKLYTNHEMSMTGSACRSSSMFVRQTGGGLIVHFIPVSFSSPFSRYYSMTSVNLVSCAIKVRKK